MPAVSVLMPCYNAAETIEEALISLKNQSLVDFEVVMVDDGSTDATPEVLEKWASHDARFQVHTRPHSGIVPTLNAGLSLCGAPLVARMDTDDRAHPQRLTLQLAYLMDHPETSLVSSRVAGFPSNQVRKGFQIYMDWLNALLTDEDIRREIFIESPLPHPSVTFRRRQAIQLGGYQDIGWAEDYDLWLRMYLAGMRFAKLPAVLLEWREHPERLTRTDSRYSLENFLRAKAHYLALGPLSGRDSVFVWGAGMTGRRLSKHLQREKIPLAGFIDIDPAKIGRKLRGLPILSPPQLTPLWSRCENPAMLAAVGARGARQKIRHYLIGLGLDEGYDWWGVA